MTSLEWRYFDDLFYIKDNQYISKTDIYIENILHPIGAKVDLSFLTRAASEKHECTIRITKHRIELGGWCPAKLLY